MTNNDILRRLRYTFDCNDATMMELFALGQLPANRAQVSNWLKQEGDDAFVELLDKELAMFLNGFIIKSRGQKEGEAPIIEQRLNNNIIFRKLRIALNMKDEDILSILESVNMRISKHELSAFFRKPNQNQYRPCNDQILRNFLTGLQLKYKSK